MISSKEFSVSILNNEGTITRSVELYNNENDDRQGIWKIQLRVFITGDLVFYATVLGKTNMAPHWCTYCDKKKRDWVCGCHTDGTPWTLELMKASLDGTQERKGCVDPPLFDCVPIESYAFPILHVMIGVGNDILKDFFRWVDWKIEEISEEEIKARKEWQKSMRQLKTHLATIAEWER